jgi:hypothetical protein
MTRSAQRQDHDLDRRTIGGPVSLRGADLFFTTGSRNPPPHPICYSTDVGALPGSKAAGGVKLKITSIKFLSYEYMELYNNSTLHSHDVALN